MDDLEKKYRRDTGRLILAMILEVGAITYVVFALGWQIGVAVLAILWARNLKQ